MAMSIARQQLEAFAMQALGNSNTQVLAKENNCTPWDAVQNAQKSVENFLDKPLIHHDWNMPLLAEVMLAWGTEDPIGYADFLSLVFKSSHFDKGEYNDLSTLDGLWGLQNILNLISDDHEYVLNEKEGFRLDYQHRVLPFQSLIGPTELAFAIANHRNMSPPSMVSPVVRSSTP